MEELQARLEASEALLQDRRDVTAAAAARVTYAQEVTAFLLLQIVQGRVAKEKNKNAQRSYVRDHQDIISASDLPILGHQCGSHDLINDQT